MRLLKVETGWVGVSPSPVVLVRLPLVVVVAQLASLVVLPLPNPNGPYRLRLPVLVRATHSRHTQRRRCNRLPGRRPQLRARAPLYRPWPCSFIVRTGLPPLRIPRQSLEVL